LKSTFSLAEVTGATVDTISNASQKVQVTSLHLDYLRNQIIFLATPWNGTEEAVKAAGNLSGKVLVDMTNPLGEGLSYALKEGSGGNKMKGSNF
jgi:predicted dinucleotide-binding enzyme